MHTLSCGFNDYSDFLHSVQGVFPSSFLSLLVHDLIGSFIPVNFSHAWYICNMVLNKMGNMRNLL